MLVVGYVGPIPRERWRLARQVLTESLLLSFAGAVCALLLIRPRDFVRTGRTQPPGESPAAAETSADSASPARSA